MEKDHQVILVVALVAIVGIVAIVLAVGKPADGMSLPDGNTAGEAYTGGCTESDGGLNFQVKGTTSYVFEGSTFSYTDTCTEDMNGHPTISASYSGRYIFEYYCPPDGSGVAARYPNDCVALYGAGSTCVNGRCQNRLR